MTNTEKAIVWFEGLWLAAESYGNPNAARNASDEALRAQAARPAASDGWVKCRERMPEDERKVVISDGIKCLLASWNERDDVWDKGRNYVPRESVTHWISLPALPEEAE